MKRIIPTQSSRRASCSTFGFTTLEMLIVIVVVMLLFTVAIINLSVAERRKKGRDTKRLSDLSVLERIITEFYLDKGVYPDLEDTTRHSNIAPAARTTAVYNAEYGWIDADFREYNIKLPVDPINDISYNYAYRHDGQTFELNARLEAMPDIMASDSGNDTLFYEVGNNLMLISP